MNKTIALLIKGVLIPLLIVLLVFGIYGAWLWNKMTPVVREDVYIDVPDSNLTVIVKQKHIKEEWLGFYYVDENKELVSFGPNIQYNRNGPSYPFEVGDYEVINNQDGTFTIRWATNPDLPKDIWDSITYEFPN